MGRTGGKIFYFAKKIKKNNNKIIIQIFLGSPFLEGRAGKGKESINSSWPKYIIIISQLCGR